MPDCSINDCSCFAILCIISPRHVYSLCARHAQTLLEELHQPGFRGGHIVLLVDCDIPFTTMLERPHVRLPELPHS